MMKMVFMITSLGGGGAERVVCNLCNYFNDRNYHISLIVIRGNEKKYEINDGVTVEYLQENYYDVNHSPWDRIEEYNLVRKRLQKLSSNEILITFLELPMALALLLKNSFPSKLIVCERNYPGAYRNYYILLFKCFVRRADGCLFQTKEIYEWYKKYLGNMSKAAIIPNSLDPLFLHAPLAKRNNKRILAVGRLDKQKNYELLIKSFSVVAKEYPQFKLDICGTGPLREELETLIKNLKVDGQVELIGFKKDILKELLNSSIFVLASNYEGMPNVLMEAMSVGLPCIVTDCMGGGARALIRDNVNGIIVPRNNENAMIDAMRKVISKPELAKKLASNALCVRTDFSPDRINAEWEIFIDNFE